MRFIAMAAVLCAALACVLPAYGASIDSPKVVSAPGDGQVKDGKTFAELNDPVAADTVRIGSGLYAVIVAKTDDGVQIVDITDPADPVPVSNFDDGDTHNMGTPVDTSDDKTYDTLDGVYGIAIAKINSKVYALVTATRDDGVQIADITNPSDPRPVASITDDSTYPELDGASGIATVQIGSSHYALVASFHDSGIQIINITDPSSPSAVASVTDDSTYPELGGARGIATAKIGSSHYALVASESDDGVQIINITNPSSPSAVASVTDDSTYPELDGARGIATAKIGSNLYALVAASADNGVQIIDITTPGSPAAVSSFDDGDTVSGRTFNYLARAHDIAIVDVRGSTYAVVTSNLDSGIQIADISDPSSPLPVFSANEGVTGFDKIGGASGITTFTADFGLYALVAAEFDDAFNILDLGGFLDSETGGSVSAQGGACSATLIHADPSAEWTAGITVTDPQGNTILDGTATLPAGHEVTEEPIAGGSLFIRTSDSRGGTVTAQMRDNGAYHSGQHACDISLASGDDTFRHTSYIPGIPSGSISEPVPASSISDGSGGFTLSGARGIATVEIGSNHYALVAGRDDGVQIVDVTDPSSPAPVSSVSDGVGGFTELNGAFGIATARIGTGHYALVASLTDDGVQVIDISNPASPAPVSSVTDGVGGFDMLDGARGIATAKIGTGHYALVASETDDGLQIIDISNPASPQPAASVTDGTTYPELGGARGIATAKIGTGHYALVAASDDSGVQIIDISNPASPQPVSSVTDGADYPELGGAYNIAIVKIGSSHYALVASQDDSGLQVIDITNPASPQPVSSVTDGVGGFDMLGGARGITITQKGSSHYALVASQDDDGLQVIDISNPASPAPVSSVTDGVGGFDELDGANGIATARIGFATYALVASQDDSGVQVIGITSPGMDAVVSGPSDPQPAASVTDGVGGFDELDGANGITTTQIGSSHYALVAASDDSGVQIIDISNPARPSAVSSFNAVTFGYDTLFDAIDIATVQIGSSHYALVTANLGSEVQIIDITDPARPSAVASLVDSTEDDPTDYDTLFGASGITLVQIGSSHYALVTATFDSGIQIIDITDPSSPSAVASLVDSTEDDPTDYDTLFGAIDIALVQINSRVYALVVATFDSGIQIIDITDPSSPSAVASVVDDSIDSNSDFDTLDLPTDIALVQINSRVYALVTATFDSGIQIIDITDPSSPSAVASVVDDSIDSNSDFDTLEEPMSPVIVEIGSKVYVLVSVGPTTSYGLQIIDISNPASPAPVSSVVDDSIDSNSDYDTLNGALGITIAQIGSSHYALVAASVDDGVQIIRIATTTDPPRPTFTAVSREDGGGADVLCMARASDIDTSHGWFIDIGLRDGAGDTVQYLSGVRPPTAKWASEAITEDGTLVGKNSIYQDPSRKFVVAKMMRYDAAPEHACFFDVGVDLDRPGPGGSITIDGMVQGLGGVPHRR